MGAGKYVRAELWHPGSTKTGKLQEGVEDLLMEENPVRSITQADHAATSQPTSGQPYSVAKVVKVTLLPFPSRMELQRRS